MAREAGRAHADKDHDVVTVVGGTKGYMPRPCPPCPWRRDNAGSFPAEAFAISAPTAYDMATNVFGCHATGTEEPRHCAGAALRTAHSLTHRMNGAQVAQIEDPGDDVLFDDYREMAVANGLDPEDFALDRCR